MVRIAATVAAFLTIACTAGAATHVRVALASKPGAANGAPRLDGEADGPAALVRRSGASRGERPRQARRPRRRLARLVSRAPGLPGGRPLDPDGARRRLDLAARNGDRRKAARTPLKFTWPTSVDVQPDGSLLVVENGIGRVDRVQPATGKRTFVASGLAKPYAVAGGTNGAIYLSNDNVLQRIDGGKPVDVLDADSQIGPIALAPDGAIAYTTGTQAFERSGDVTRTLASSLGNPHGIAVTDGGKVLVSDTGNGRVLRIDPQTGATTTLIRTAEPRGIAVAADGSLYLVEAGAKRVGHYSAAGARLGSVGPVFDDPYDVDTAADGTVYVVETAASGSIVRVAPNGSWSKLSSG